MAETMIPATSANDVANKIRMANQKFIEAFHRKDASGVASLYTHSALLFPPGADITEGFEAITRFWKGAMDMGITDVKLETVSVEDFGNAAAEVGKYTLVAGSAVADEGKYIVVWRLEDGAWKLHRDIWNTSKSATRA